MFSISIKLEYFQVFPVNSSLTHSRSVLFNFQIFERFLDILFLLFSNLILLWSEKVLDLF